MRMWSGSRSAQLLCSALQLALLQAYLLPYVPQHREECQNPYTEHFVEAINRCCSLCAPGFHVLKSCSESVDTECVPCEDGMFTKTWSRAELCFSCRPQCNQGLVQVKECNRTQNLLCWCPAHQFCSVKHSDECIHCQVYTQCEKGHGVVQPGTPSSDVQCAPCPLGTFSDVESDSAICRPHQICKFELLPGNSTSNAICSNSRVSPGITATSPRSTTTAKRPRDKVTRTPTLDVKRAPSTDISSTVGWVAGMMFVIIILLGGTFLVFAFRKRGGVPPCGKEKQASIQKTAGDRNRGQALQESLVAYTKGQTAQTPLPRLDYGTVQPPELCSANAKMSGNWPQASSALRQEEQNLLQTSASSSSLDRPSGSDRSSGCSKASTLQSAAECSQERSPSNIRVHQSRAEPKQSGNRGTHVNVSCIVNVCNSDHSLQFQSLNAPAADSGDGALAADLPLSKEESALKRAWKTNCS